MEVTNGSFIANIGDDKKVSVSYQTYEGVAGTPIKPLEDILLESVPDATGLVKISKAVEYPLFSVRLSDSSAFDEVVFNFTMTSAFGDVPKDAPSMQMFGASRFMLNLVNYGDGTNIGTTMFIPTGLTYDSEKAAWGLRADTGERWFPTNVAGLGDVTDKLGELVSDILGWLEFAGTRHALRNGNG